MKHWVPIVAFMIAIFFATSFIQNDLSSKRFDLFISDYRNASLHHDVIYVPLNSSIIKLLAPADSSFLSDLLWMRAAYYFGFHALSDRQYPYLIHLLDIITDLSPQWEYPYNFGAALLPTEAGSAEEGYYIIDKGLRQFPDDWQLWFFKGYYQWQIDNNLVEAAETLKHASLLPGAPQYLARLPATLATKAGHRELAFRFIHESLKQVKDENQKQILLEKLQEMLKHE